MWLDRRARNVMAIVVELSACVGPNGLWIAPFVPMDARLTDLKEDIARRLRPVMSDFPEAEFSALVKQMAEIQYKYEPRRRIDLFDSEELAR